MVLLNGGETVLKTATVTRHNPQGSRTGVLTLTNHRLIFEAQIPQGPMGAPMVRTTIDAPLFRIRNAEVLRSTFGGARLQVELPMQVGVFETPEADAWLQMISQARSAMPRPAGPGAAAPAAAPSVVLRCRYCGNLNAPTLTKCTGCGAPI